MDTLTQRFSAERLLARRFPDVQQTYGPRDCILYALGIGFGTDPLDRSELPFVFEEPRLEVVPSMALVLASPGFWARDAETGIDWRRLLHAESEVLLHRALPPGGTVHARTRVTQVIDKGAEKGALIYAERIVRDQSEVPIATVRTTSFARSNGGCGGSTAPQPAPHALPSRPAELCVDSPIDRRAALLYRLSGDPNPLHADPAVAAAAGFDRPILHGLCTLGIAVRVLLRAYCDLKPERLRSVKVRFSRPVFPGETIRTEMWRDGSVVSFRAVAAGRNVTALDHGRAEIA